MDGAARDLSHQAILHCEAWIKLVRRRNSQPKGAEVRQWQKNSKGWKLLQWAADLVRPSVDSHTVFVPPALQGRDGQRPCSSLEEVRKWSKANEPNEPSVCGQGNGGLEFRCQLNTPTLDRLRQLKSLCATNQPAQFRRSLIDQQDLIRLREEGYEKNGYHTARGG